MNLSFTFPKSRRRPTGFISTEIINSTKCLFNSTIDDWIHDYKHNRIKKHLISLYPYKNFNEHQMCSKLVFCSLEDCYKHVKSIWGFAPFPICTKRTSCQLVHYLLITDWVRANRLSAHGSRYVNKTLVARRLSAHGMQIRK